MYNLQDIEDKIFFECKNILESLSKINSLDELLIKQDLFYEVSERIAFLKLLQKNSSYLENDSDMNAPLVDAHTAMPDSEFANQEKDNTQEEIIEEEVIFTNQLNEIDADEFEVEEEIAGEIIEDAGEEVNEHYSNFEEESNYSPIEDRENKEQENVDPTEPVFSFMAPQPVVIEDEIAATSDFNETLTESSEETSEVITNQLDTENVSHETSMPKRQVAETHISDEQPTQEEINTREQKIKLAKLKGLKNIESLFSEEHFNQPNVSDSDPISEPVTQLVTTSPLAEFRIDLNDKLAFSKMLFNGSQADLNDTIRVLNSLQTLDQAKEYLSELYYDRNWKKVDEYAQRLWTLVENRFL